MSITNSSFTNLDRAFYHTTANDSTDLMVFTGNTVDSVTYGFRFRADSGRVADNDIGRVRLYGVYAEPSFSNRAPKRVVVERNTVTCSVQASYTAYGIYTYYLPATVDTNAVRDCDYGIYSYYPSSGALYPLSDLNIRSDTVFMPTDGSGQTGIYVYGRWGLAKVARNTVRRGVTGMYLRPDIDIASGDTALVRLDTNAVSEATTRAVWVFPVDAVSVVGVRNNISGNALDGIVNAGSGTRSFTLGRFVGNARWAISGTAAITATSNWWGSTSGAGGANGSGLADADSVSSSTTDVTSPLGSDPGDVPPLGAPFDPVGAGRVAAVTAAAFVTQPPPPDDAVEWRDWTERRAALERAWQGRELVKEAERTARQEVRDRARGKRRRQ